MSSIRASKSSCKHSCDKCPSPGTSNISLDESNSPIRTNDINIHGNSYVNTPSPSSIASSNSFKNHSKNDYHPHMSSKRRYRQDRLFHHTHSLNRQYIVTMTNILFQMQKEIYKLKRRTHHVEQMLANQIQAGQPIIRIPRLTKDELSIICMNDNENLTICINDSENQQNIASTVSEEHENNNESSPTTTTNLEPSNDVESSITLELKSQTNDARGQPTRNKTCSACNHVFSHRSAYLRHIRRVHHGVYPTKSNNNTLLEADISHNETSVLSVDQSDNGNESDLFQVLGNQWDFGGRELRPRRVSKSKNGTITKVKCDICNKFFRADYIKKHERRTHHATKPSSSSELDDTLNQITSTIDKPVNDIQTTCEKSPNSNTNPLSEITVAEMDIDDMPIRFRKELNKPIVLAVTCLEPYQSDIIEEFLQKFSSRVCQTSTVDSRTTHLITNDDQRFLRSPLSMKLIEGIAHHCFCVSYRWIIDCLKYDRIIDESPYEIEGDNTDYHPHGGPKRSRLIEKRNSLFEKICFMIKCTEDNDMNMTNDRLQDLITTCGGQIITCVTQNLLNEYDIVVLCDTLYVSERRHNYDQCRSLGIHFVSSDWVLESILEYRRKIFLSYEETPL